MRYISTTELDDFSKGLQDIYGPYPTEVNNLIGVMSLKLKLKKLGIVQAKINPNFFSMRVEPGTLVQRKIKENNISNDPCIRYYKRGARFELKMLSDTGDNINTQNNILYKANKFLEEMMNEYVSLT